jgi:hypothetical protein
VCMCVCVCVCMCERERERVRERERERERQQIQRENFVDSSWNAGDTIEKYNPILRHGAAGLDSRISRFSKLFLTTNLVWLICTNPKYNAKSPKGSSENSNLDDPKSWATVFSPVLNSVPTGPVTSVEVVASEQSNRKIIKSGNLEY